MKKFLKSVIRHCAVVLLLTGVFYAMSVCVVQNNVQATSVSARAAASGFNRIMVGPSLDNQIGIVDLYDGPYMYEESEKLSCIVCFIPFSYTRQYLNDGSGGLIDSVMWRDGSLLSRGGMMRMDNRFYFVDYEEAMATEIDLFWERNGGDESPIGLGGVVFEITTETSPEVDSPIEWMICAGVSLVSGRVGAHMAVAVFAFLAGLVMYLLFLGIYGTIEYIYKESTRGVERD